MPPPTNTTALTATAVGALPASVTQNVHDAGTTYTVWYRVTAPADVTVLGAWAFGDLVTYQPTLTPYAGPASAPTQIAAIEGLNVPIQVPVTAGQEYFLEIRPNSGNPTPASLVLSVLAAPQAAPVAGDVLVPTGDLGTAAVVYNPAGDYLVRGFLPTVPVSDAGSQACILPNGYLLINEDATKLVHVLSPAFASLTSTPYGASGGAASIALRSNRTANVFYFTKDVNPVVVRSFDATGSLRPATHTLTVNNCRSLCVNNDETILYHAGTPLGSAIKRWDLVGAAALSDLAPGVANHFTQDLLVLATGEIVGVFSDASLGGQGVIRRYTAAGVQQAEYPISDLVNGATVRLAYDQDVADTHIMVWGHTVFSGATISQFVRLRLSDGARVRTTAGAEFGSGGMAGQNPGEYNYAPTATPIARFGNHNCCPFLVLPGAPPVAAYHLEERPIRRLRRAPHVANENSRVFYRKFELDLERGVGLATGQGETPLVMLRCSRDGGHTWGESIEMSAGALGVYTQRVIARRLGHARDMVFEITVSDPVQWSIVQAWLDLEPGTS
jgi:hypothetical protein